MDPGWLRLAGVCPFLFTLTHCGRHSAGSGLRKTMDPTPDELRQMLEQLLDDLAEMLENEE